MRDKRVPIVALLFLATVINYVDRQVLSVNAPLIRDELGLSNVDYSRIVFSFLLAYTIMLAFSGVLIDRLGTRRGFALSIVWWSAAGMMHAGAASALGFAVVRFLLGMGEAGNWPGAMKAVAEWFPARSRAMARRDLRFRHQRRSHDRPSARRVHHASCRLARGLPHHRSGGIPVARGLALDLLAAGPAPPPGAGRSAPDRGRDGVLDRSRRPLDRAPARADDLGRAARPHVRGSGLVVLRLLASRVLDPRAGIQPHPDRLSRLDPVSRRRPRKPGRGAGVEPPHPPRPQPGSGEEGRSLYRCPGDDRGAPGGVGLRPGLEPGPHQPGDAVVRGLGDEHADRLRGRGSLGLGRLRHRTGRDGSGHRRNGVHAPDGLGGGSIRLSAGVRHREAS